MASLTISDLKKSYGAVEILKGINIEIEDGGFLVLVGPSGCGKSTLLNTIAGLEDITSGDIKIGETSVAGLHPSKRDIAMVFQSYALYPNMSVAQNIAFGMEMRGVAKPERDKAVADVADLLQISKLLDRKPSQLSGGQRQRVAMGRALVRNPQVFLFDEPLSNLDAKLRVDMRTEIKRMHQRMATTTVYVTHDQIEALTLATKIAVLKDGSLQQFGTPDEIYNDPANVFVAEFMGSPSMNMLTMPVEQDAGGLFMTLKREDGSAIRVPLPDNAALRSKVGKPVIFGIRPESLTDPASADRTATGELLEADFLIDVTEPAGADVFAVTTLNGRHVTARVKPSAAVHDGQNARLALNLARAVFFDPATQDRLR
ncbi:MAG: ABC transporter ATP-binding protein [Albidovulum sp.]